MRSISFVALGLALSLFASTAEADTLCNDGNPSCHHYMSPASMDPGSVEDPDLRRAQKCLGENNIKSRTFRDQQGHTILVDPKEKEAASCF